MRDLVESAAREREQRYRDMAGGASWLEANVERVVRLLRDGPILGHVFGPFAELVRPRRGSDDDSIRGVITQVAVICALLAGIPGQMGGAGVAVCQGFEVWMAYRIACRVGLRLAGPGDVLKYFGLLAGVLVVIFEGMRVLIRLLYIPLSVLPFAMVPVELLATDIVGVAFWVGFQEAREHGAFTIPRRLFGAIWRESRALFGYQWRKLKALLTRDQLGGFGRRFAAYFRGDVVAPTPPVPDDLFVALAMAALVGGETTALNGPLGGLFVQSIRDLYPDLAEADLPTIAGAMAAYDDEQMTGVLANLKGRLFERLIEHTENTDGDLITARLHADRTHPGTDLVLHNTATGEMVEVSLKATDHPGVIEEALSRYPEDQVLTTDEVARHFAGDARVDSSGVENEYLTKVTADNFDELVGELPPSPLAIAAGVGAGLALALSLKLWPFVAAWLRGRISLDQLRAACGRVLGESGNLLVAKLALMAMLGPAFAWWALARAAQSAVRAVGIDDGGGP